MKTKIFYSILFIICFTYNIYAQWPGYFYAFELKDPNGNIVDSSSTDYRMTAMPCAGCDLITSIKMCEGNKLWQFYAGGNHDLDKTNYLKIDRLISGNVETMTIEFPASLSGGKEKFYRNLYVGEIIFAPGNYTVKLPNTGKQWDNLREMNEEICRLYYAVSVYYDISGFQGK